MNFVNPLRQPHKIAIWKKLKIYQTFSKNGKSSDENEKGFSSTDFSISFHRSNLVFRANIPDNKKEKGKRLRGICSQKAIII